VHHVAFLDFSLGFVFSVVSGGLNQIYDTYIAANYLFWKKSRLP